MPSRPASADLLPLRAELFGSVFVLTQYLARRADAVLEPLGITTKQWLLLAVLTRRFPGESPTLSEAALWHGSSRQNVKQIAQQLQDRGFLRITPDPADRRALRLHLTDRVGALDSPAERARQAAFFDEAFAALGPAETGQLLRLVQRWLASVTPR
ncbi:MAG: MarR family transcriptional regulator [Deltaproteobacteria bacterium]|nr:MarR family transcriptional regulator [Deltaproteobacteria bacterium]